ncbi:MAG TPA: hypothetical protein VG844_03840 [Terracidiphilus sp.]|nr:hypothetical protein [Terracidiphilus sp.]
MFLGIGAIACFAIAMRLFNHRIVEAASGVFAIAVIIANFLVSLEKDYRNEDDSARRVLLKLFSIRKVVVTMTVAVWILLIGLTVNLLVVTQRERNLIKISGYVQNSDGSLATEASVTLAIGASTFETLTKDGRFSFPRVQKPDYNHRIAQIEARWADRVANKTIDVSSDVSSDSLSNLILKLPQGHPPFRVQYFLLGGHAVDLFLKGMLDREWEEQLGGQPYILPNNTFQKLNEFVEKFSEPFQSSMLFTPDYFRKMKQPAMSDSSEAEERAAALATKFQGTPMFVGTDATLAAVSILRPASHKDIDSLSDVRSGWHLKASPLESGGNDSDAITYWRFGTASDLTVMSDDQFSKRLIAWLQFVTKEQFPKDFCIVTMASEGCDPDRNQNIAVNFRSVWLRIAVIENLTPHSLHIGSFVTKEHDSDSLRSREDDQASLDSGQPTPHNWFAPQDLEPGEKIAIPLEIVLRFDKDKNWSLYHLEKDSETERLSQLRDKIGQTPAVNLKYYANRSEYVASVPTDALLRMINEPTTNMGLNKEYIFGPSNRIEGLVVDDAEYPVRQFDPHMVVIRDGNGTGSCPFVYTYSSLSKEWSSEGRILYGARGRNREMVDSLKLEEFDGRIVLREEEPETTFISSVYISVRNPSGNERIYYPSNWSSFKSTNSYIQLKQGNAIELRFPPLPSDIAGKPRLVARGFYEPY